MTDLTRKSTRERLKVRREPYWQGLSKGAALGFHRGVTSNTWRVRRTDRTGKKTYQALDGVTGFDEAKAAAEAWLDQLGNGGAVSRSKRRSTVRDALLAYVEHLTRQGRPATAKTSLTRFEQIVWPDPIADLPLHSLTRHDLREWRERLKGYDAVTCPKCGGVRRLAGSEGASLRCTKCRTPLDPRKKHWVARQNRSTNRHVRSVVAGLNCAVVELGHVGNVDAWKLSPLADDIDDGGETAVVLDAIQRRAMIDAAAPDAAMFLRAVELTGARPGELAAATVADLDIKHATLRLSHRKGRPPKLRARVVDIYDSIAHFAEAAKGKLPSARLFTQTDGEPWQTHDWAVAVRAAIQTHNSAARGAKRLPHDASAYSLRHARISELLQVHNVDPLTVAAQCGTSIKMIEKAYFRFIPSAMRDKLKAAS